MKKAAIRLLFLALPVLAFAQTKKILVPDIPADWVEKIEAAVPGAKLVPVHQEDIEKQIGDADAIVGGVTRDQLAIARQLKWVQTMSAGVDDVLFPALVSSDVTVTNMRIVYGPEIADHAFAFLLALTRKLNLTIPAQKNEEWHADRAGMTELKGKTAVIIGVGGIGRQIAQRAFGFGMNVIGVDIQDYPPDVLVPRYVHPDQLDEVLPLADVVFVSVPLTAKSQGMMGGKQFEEMKKGSYFIAVSRGKTYSMDGLVKALDEQRLAGAGVDVTNPEPLPKGHPLWKFPNAIITPHQANGSDKLAGRQFDILKENVRRFVAGEPLLNVVNKQAGF